MMFFFFHDSATTDIYSLSLHDALPILARPGQHHHKGHERASGLTDLNVAKVPPVGLGLFIGQGAQPQVRLWGWPGAIADRKSTRLNSSHVRISYAVFCLKKKK